MLFICCVAVDASAPQPKNLLKTFVMWPTFLDLPWSTLLPCFALSCLILPVHLSFPYLDLPNLALPCFTLHCPTIVLPYVVFPYLLYLVVPYISFPYLCTLFCFVLVASTWYAIHYLTLLRPFHLTLFYYCLTLHLYLPLALAYLAVIASHYLAYFYLTYLILKRLKYLSYSFDLPYHIDLKI